MGWAQVAEAGGKAILEAHAKAKQSQAQNKAIMRFNEKMQYESMQAVNQMNLERSSIISQQQRTLFDIQANAASTDSAIQLQAAATDTIGASVSDAISSVNTASSLDMGEATSQFNEQMTAWEIQSTTALRQAEYNLKEAESYSTWNNFRDAFINQAINIGGEIAANNMVDGMIGAFNAYSSQSGATGTDLYGTYGKRAFSVNNSNSSGAIRYYANRG